MAKFLQQAAELRKRVKDQDEGKLSSDPTPKGKGIKRKAVSEAVHATEADISVAVPAPEKIKSISTGGNAKRTSGARKAKDDAAAKKTVKKVPNASNVIYLGHIPDGFGETELSSFFKQFGKVVKVKLFRSPKTNASKGYAFIKFEAPEIATVVAEAMDGYFIMERQFVCNVVPVDKLHDGMFKNKKTKAQSVETDAGSDEEAAEADEKSSRKSARKVANLKQKQLKLKEMGIEYDFSGHLLA
jgi:nucleolar protein 15